MSYLMFYIYAMAGAVLGGLLGIIFYKAVPKKEPEVKALERWKRAKALGKNFDRQLGIALVIGLVIFSVIYMSDGTFAERVDYYLVNLSSHESAANFSLTLKDGMFIFLSAMLEFVIFGIWISRERRMKRLVEAYRP